MRKYYKAPWLTAKWLWSYASSEITAFHNDPAIQSILEERFTTGHARTFCETGLFRGDSLRWVAERFPSVACHSIEVNPVYSLLTGFRLRHLKNVKIHRGDSSKVLPDLLPTLMPPIVFWLDAHWGISLPLKAELDTITSSRKYGLLMVDDLGDSYAGQTIGFDVLKERGFDSRNIGTVAVADFW